MSSQMAISLSERAETIIRQYPERAGLKSVIEKELLHYDIFFIMQQQALRIPDMSFIGGTCLRLCHGSNRYSEDLDFHAGSNFKPQDFEKISAALGKYLLDRYGLPIEIREPKQLKDDPDYANSAAHTWKIIVQTQPQQKHLPAQRIHIDIANVPCYSVKDQLIQTQYSDLPDGYDMMLFPAATRSEILADKLIAIPARNNIKARDLWDVVWLLQQRTPIEYELVQQKIEDHSLNNFQELLANRIESLEDYFTTSLFVDEMSRFLDSNRLSETVQRPEFMDYLKTKIFEQLMMLQNLQNRSDGFEL